MGQHSESLGPGRAVEFFETWPPRRQVDRTGGSFGASASQWARSGIGLGPRLAASRSWRDRGWRRFSKESLDVNSCFGQAGTSKGQWVAFAFFGADLGWRELGNQLEFTNPPTI